MEQQKPARRGPLPAPGARRPRTNPYVQLLGNMALFAASSLAAKLVALGLTRLYTGLMGQDAYGQLDLVVACVNLAIPLASLGMFHAIIRFGLDREEPQAAVFSTGLALTAAGCFVAAWVLPLALRRTQLAALGPLLAGYVAVSCVRNSLSQAVRAKRRTVFYAADGVLNAVYLLGFNLLFLQVLRLGLAGYLLAVAAADALSAAGLYLFGGLGPQLRWRNWSRPLAKRMLRYALPLVPTSLLWWVITAGDRFLLVWVCGTGANGLYAVACKVPALISLFSTIFTEAWQISAVERRDAAEQKRFFTRVFCALAFAAFLCCGGLMLLAQPVVRLLAAPAFFAAWQCVPALLLGAFFLCLSSFLNSVYMVEKRSGASLLTMAVGAVGNVALNGLLIPRLGPLGAALGTAGAYAAVFALRLASAWRLIALGKQGGWLAMVILFLSAMCWACTCQIRHWAAVSLGLMGLAGVVFLFVFAARRRAR